MGESSIFIETTEEMPVPGYIRYWLETMLPREY
jgi:hypothetical protein